VHAGMARAIVRAGGGGTQLNAGDYGLCDGKNSTRTWAEGIN